MAHSSNTGPGIIALLLTVDKLPGHLQGLGRGLGRFAFGALVLAARGRLSWGTGRPRHGFGPGVLNPRESPLGFMPQPLLCADIAALFSVRG